MNAYEFGQQLGALEKQADKSRGLQNFFGDMWEQGFGGAAKTRRAYSGKAPTPRVNVPNALSVPGAGSGGGTPASPSIMQRLQNFGSAAADEGLTSLDNLGRFTRHHAGRAIDNTRNFVNRLRNPAVDLPNAPPQARRLGYTNPDERALSVRNAPQKVENALVPGPRGFVLVDPPGRTWGNIGTGAGVGLGAAAGLTAVNPFRGGEPTQQNLQAQQMNTQLAAAQHAATRGQGQGLGGMWNSLPVEARYAIGAGVPIALIGALMGSRGNYGMGAGLGALGLGAAGLGAAGAGMFGEGPRRMVGQGANALYGMLGRGGDGNVMNQIDMLRQFSPEMGATMLMGRDPNMDSAQARQMYDFLVNNRNIIEQLLPQLQNSSVNSVKQGAALEFGAKVARCWEGYEPVPGKKPYSNDSCRPAGGKKKDKKEKKAVSSAARGKTEMTCTPSSRGSQKMIDDKQRAGTSPVPTDAANAQQPGVKAAAPFEKMDLTAPASTKAKLVGKSKKKMTTKCSAEEKQADRARGLFNLVGAGMRAGSRAIGAGASSLGQSAVSRSGNRGLMGATGRGLNRAGQAAQWAGTQVAGQPVRNAARTALATGVTGAAAYGMYNTPKLVDPAASAVKNTAVGTYNYARDAAADAYRRSQEYKMEFQSPVRFTRRDGAMNEQPPATGTPTGPSMEEFRAMQRELAEMRAARSGATPPAVAPAASTAAAPTTTEEFSW